MLSRRAILILSIALSVVFHALLLVFAPRIPIVGASLDNYRVLNTFRVDLAKVPPPPEPPTEPPTAANRPGEVGDLLKDAEEPLTPDEALLRGAAEVPMLEDRVAADPVEREHDLDLDGNTLEKVDAKVLEIAEEVARRDIEVARRLVRPSPSRIIGENEFPTFRSEGGLLGGEEVLSIQRRGSGGWTRSGNSLGASGGEGKPAYEEGVFDVAKLPGESDALRPIDEIELATGWAPEIGRARAETDYAFLDDQVAIKVDAYCPAGEEEGYFRLRIVPKEGEDMGILPKDISFIVDASSSILQRKLDSTVAAVIRALQALRPEDRFNVIIFRDTATEFRPDFVPATPQNIAAARSFLDGLESRGETDVYKAIRPVVLQPPREGVPNIVMMLSDGRPTAGVRDGRTIINALTSENAQRKTIYAFGGGGAVNRYLLDLLAYRNKGRSYVAPQIDDIETDLSRFLARLKDPILVDLHADYGRIDEKDVFPKEIPDFYTGQVVTVYGRFDPKKDKEFVMRLRGVGGDQKKEVVFRAPLGKAATGDSDIAREWAFRKIYYLIGEICRVGETPELLAELRRLSREYNIRTSYDD